MESTEESVNRLLLGRRREKPVAARLFSYFPKIFPNRFDGWVAARSDRL